MGTPPKRQEIVDLVEKEKGDLSGLSLRTIGMYMSQMSAIRVVRNIKDINKVTEICSYKLHCG